VAKAASENLTPCILELGGKSPLVIDESADVDFTAYKVIFGKFQNGG
jgi:aldehyde dehydrogenase (NAD+)